MTERQARFVAAMVAGAQSYASAARTAGYSPTIARQVGSLNMTKDDVQAAILAPQEAAALATGFTAARIVTDLHETHREARDARQYGPAVSALGRILEHVAPQQSEAKLEIVIRRGGDVP